MQVNVSLGAFPGKTYQGAMELAVAATEPKWGALSVSHVQLCPQNFGQLTQTVVDQLKLDYPDTQFRLHANVRVLPKLELFDLSQYFGRGYYFDRLAEVSKTLNAPAYTAHAGKKENADFIEIARWADQLSSKMGCPVGIEGHYPTKGNSYLVSDWAEYRELFESGAFYALDLSHLNIVATATGFVDIDLVGKMISSNRCLEVHVSENDGIGDTHQQSGAQYCWWESLLGEIHPKAVVFTEGNQIRSVRPRVTQ